MTLEDRVNITKNVVCLIMSAAYIQYLHYQCSPLDETIIPSCLLLDLISQNVVWLTMSAAYI